MSPVLKAARLSVQNQPHRASRFHRIKGALDEWKPADCL